MFWDVHVAALRELTGTYEKCVASHEQCHDVQVVCDDVTLTEQLLQVHAHVYVRQNLSTIYGLYIENSLICLSVCRMLRLEYGS